ncbi:hypothetical protein [Microbulbifer sp. Q7]|uniref:hypothetical protein n=1 Tax=Microbulbifer sp. Q7 TaxID=1785091 RepID=UPI000829B7F9|nr:hypothetical protein [Microbulbifer sp. Q7]
MRIETRQVAFNPQKILGDGQLASAFHLRGEWGDRCGLSIFRTVAQPPYSEEYLLGQIVNDESVWTNFPCCHGDVAGRWIWAHALATSHEPGNPPAYLKSLVDKAIALQQADGHYGNATIKPGVETMLGAYGNGWMLQGIASYAQVHGGEPVIAALRAHVDWYLDQYEYWEEVSRKISERGTEFYAVTPSGYFHGLNGLIEAYKVLKDARILELAKRIIDLAPPLEEADHSHSYLTIRRGCLAYAQLVGDSALQHRVIAELEQVWQEFVLEAGGIPERFRHFDDDTHIDDEGCSHSDWILLCLKLHHLTGEKRWLDRAILCIENQFFYNQNINGGFGARLVLKNNYLQMGKESYWCCSLYGPAAMLEGASYLTRLEDETLTLHYPLEGELVFGDDRVRMQWSEDLRAYSVDLSAAPGIKAVNLYQPHWMRASKSIEGACHQFAVAWQFWNAQPERAPEAVVPEAGGRYTQFLGPWMMVSRPNKASAYPAIPMAQLHETGEAPGLEVRTMHKLPQSGKSLSVVLSSDVDVSIYDVFSWATDKPDTLRLYPLKDKESPDSAKSWFSAVAYDSHGA